MQQKCEQKWNKNVKQKCNKNVNPKYNKNVAMGRQKMQVRPQNLL